MSGRHVKAPLSAFVLCMTATGAAVDEDFDLDLLSSLGGTAQACFVDGITANLDRGPHLVVLSLADPEAPVVLGRLR